MTASAGLVVATYHAAAREIRAKAAAIEKRALGWFQDLVENPVEIFSVDFVVEAAARIFQFNFRLKAVFPCVGKRSPYRTVAQFIL